MTQISGNVTATTLVYDSVAVLVDNGDFETGDWTSWTVGVTGTAATATILTDESATAYGSNAQFYTDGDYTHNVSIVQSSIDISSYTTLLFDYNVIIPGEVEYEGEYTYGILDYLVDTGDGEGDLFGYINTSSASGWTTFSTPLLESPATTTATLNFTFWSNTATPCALYLDNIKFGYVQGECTSATIEDSSKDWTADQLNGYTFILTTGASKNYSCLITDTFSNYLQVPTTFTAINYVNTIFGNYEDFEDAATIVLNDGGFWTAYNGWTNDDELQVIMSNTIAHTGTICISINQGPE